MDDNNKRETRRDALFGELEKYCTNTMKGQSRSVVYVVNEHEAVGEIRKLDPKHHKPAVDLVKATGWRANNFKPKTFGIYVEICHLCGNTSSHNCHVNICTKCGIEIPTQHYVCASCKRTT